MTTLTAPAAHDFGSIPRSPSLPRLLAGGIVATLGVLVLSIAVGDYVVGSSRMVVPAQGDVAHGLVAATPILVAIGLLHLLAAIALARGRDGLRIVAVLATGLMSLAAASSAAMLVAGVNPFGSSGATHPSATGIGLLAIAAVLYGVAAVAAGSGPAES